MKTQVIVHELQQRSVASNTGNGATYNCDAPYNPAGTSGRRLKLTCNRITPTIVQGLFLIEPARNSRFFLFVSLKPHTIVHLQSKTSELERKKQSTVSVPREQNVTSLQ